MTPRPGVHTMDILMPQLGETVSEGKITLWYKSPGDRIEAGDNLFEIETEKVSMDVPAIAAGVLSEIRVAAGETVQVGAVVAIVSDSSSTTAAAAPAPAPAPTPRPARELDPFHEVLTPQHNYGPARVGGVATTPLARRMAAQGHIDLSIVRGSGPEGRVSAKDVEALRPGAAQGQSRAPAGASGPAGGLSAEQVKALYDAGSCTQQPLDGMRNVIARRLTQSKQSVPHFYLTVDLEIDALARRREEINAAAPQLQGQPVYKLSLNDCVIKLWAAALQRVPAANAVWAEDCILRFTQVDIGVAVAVEGGLLTPVVRRADEKPPESIATEIRDLAARARARRLRPDELQGGVSTVSNLGMYGVREFSAIINPPQSTILAVGALQRRALEAPGGGVRFASLMTVTLSCDHRVVDGVCGAEALAALRELALQPF